MKTNQPSLWMIVIKKLNSNLKTHFHILLCSYFLLHFEKLLLFYGTSSWSQSVLWLCFWHGFFYQVNIHLFLFRRIERLYYGKRQVINVHFNLSKKSPEPISQNFIYDRTNDKNVVHGWKSREKWGSQDY